MWRNEQDRLAGLGGLTEERRQESIEINQMWIVNTSRLREEERKRKKLGGTKRSLSTVCRACEGTCWLTLISKLLIFCVVSLTAT